jgi:hypothetical protein
MGIADELEGIREILKLRLNLSIKEKPMATPITIPDAMNLLGEVRPTLAGQPVTLAEPPKWSTNAPDVFQLTASPDGLNCAIVCAAGQGTITVDGGGLTESCVVTVTPGAPPPPPPGAIDSLNLTLSPVHKG